MNYISHIKKTMYLFSVSCFTTNSQTLDKKYVNINFDLKAYDKLTSKQKIFFSISPAISLLLTCGKIFFHKGFYNEVDTLLYHKSESSHSIPLPQIFFIFNDIFRVWKRYINYDNGEELFNFNYLNTTIDFVFPLVNVFLCYHMNARTTLAEYALFDGNKTVEDFEQQLGSNGMVQLEDIIKSYKFKVCFIGSIEIVKYFFERFVYNQWLENVKKEKQQSQLSGGVNLV